MTTEYILSQIFICLSALLFTVSLQFNNKAQILFIQIFACVLYFSHYFLLGVILGGCFAIIEMLRLIAFYVIDKNKKINTTKINTLVSIIFAIIFIITSLITWNAWFCIMPLVASVIVSLALGRKNVIVIKVAFLIQSVLITTYLFLISSTVGAISQIVVFIGSCIGIATMLVKQRKKIIDNELTKKMS